MSIFTWLVLIMLAISTALGAMFGGLVYLVFGLEAGQFSGIFAAGFIFSCMLEEFSKDRDTGEVNSDY